eukprot:166652_1
MAFEMKRSPGSFDREDVAQFRQSSGMESVTYENVSDMNYLHASIRNGDVESVRRIFVISGPEDVNRLDQFGTPPVVYAAFSSKPESLEILELLLTHDGIDANLSDKKQNNALMTLASRPPTDLSIEKFKMVFNFPGIDFRALNAKNQTALHSSCQKSGDNPIFVNMLLRHKDIDLNAVDVNGCTALHLACLVGYRAAIYEFVLMETLNPLGINFNIQSNAVFGCTPLGVLTHSSPDNYLECIKEFLKVSSDSLNINCRDKHKRTGLHHAAIKGDVEMIGLLRNIDGRRWDDNGKTALHLALEHNRPECFGRLLTCSREHAVNNEGQNPLHLAAKMKKVGFIDMLRKIPYSKYNDINAKDNNGDTALLIALKSGGQDSVKAVLKFAGIDLSINDNETSSPLMLAIEQGSVTSVQDLVTVSRSIEDSERALDVEHTKIRCHENHAFSQLMPALSAIKVESPPEGEAKPMTPD